VGKGLDVALMRLIAMSRFAVILEPVESIGRPLAGLRPCRRARARSAAQARNLPSHSVANATLGLLP